MNLTLFLLPILMIAFGMPVFLALLIAVVVTLAFFMNLQPTMLHQTLYGSISNYSLLAIPFFIFAGEVMGRGGITRRIIDWVMALVGRAPGALGLVTVGTSTIYGAISGSSPATVATVGRQLLPELLTKGYGRQFSLGLLNSSGAISIVIPPSINLILYSAVSNQSVATLFIAGILPGLALSLSLAACVLVYSIIQDVPTTDGFNLGDLLRASRRAAWSLLTPVAVLGSIYTGFTSPTEAAGVACVYAVFVATVVHRELNLADIVRIAGDSVILTAQILIIAAAAGVFSWILTISGFPAFLASFVSGLNASPTVLLICINVLLLVVGCFIDPTSAVLTLTPFLLPIAMIAGVDPIHFGIVMTVNLSIGMYTPPFGLNLFVSQTSLKARTVDIYAGVLPFVLIEILVLMIISFVPSLSLWFV